MLCDDVNGREIQKGGDMCVRLGVSKYLQEIRNRAMEMWGAWIRAHLAEHVWCCLSAFGHAPQLFPSALDPPADPAPAPLPDPSLQGSLPSPDDRKAEPSGEPAENPRVRIPQREHLNA